MPREKELYREHLFNLREKFGGDTELIPLKEVAKFLGRTERTLKKLKGFPIKKIGGRYDVPITNLASWLS